MLFRRIEASTKEMKLTKNGKIILSILLGSAFIGAGLYFGLRSRQTPRSAECAHIPPLKNNASKKVIEVIDGDTLVIEGDYSVRLIGIDADERGDYCYENAKSRLEDLILDKKIALEQGQEDVDKYCRYLRYAFVDSLDIGLTLVKEGLAKAHFYSNTAKYRSEYIKAEESAKAQQTGCIWNKQNAEVGNKESETGNHISEAEKEPISWQELTEEKTEMDIVPVCDAGTLIGEEVIVEGIAVDTYRSRTNTVFLNFGSAYPKHCFTAVIFNSDQHRFPHAPESLYKNKTLRIRGPVKIYEGKPEIILERSEQIEIGSAGF